MKQVGEILLILEIGKGVSYQLNEMITNYFRLLKLSCSQSVSLINSLG